MYGKCFNGYNTRRYSFFIEKPFEVLIILIHITKTILHCETNGDNRTTNDKHHHVYRSVIENIFGYYVNYTQL